MPRLILTLSLMAISAILLSSCATVPMGSAETGYAVHGFVGKNSQTAAPGTNVLLLNGSTGKALATDKADFFGKFAFQGLQPGHYQLKVGQIVQDVVIVAENVRRDIDLSNPEGTMNYADVGMKELEGQIAEAAAGKSTSAAPAAPAGPNDKDLAAKMAGIYWGYSGSTETKIGLCPDGRYGDFRESGYSGTMTDGGGAQTGAWGTANQSDSRGTWVIQGTTESGTISVRYNNGNTKTIRYELVNNDPCFRFDGTLLCRTSKQCGGD